MKDSKYEKDSWVLVNLNLDFKYNGFSGMKLLSHPSRLHAHSFYERRGYLFTKDQKNFIKEFQD